MRVARSVDSRRAPAHTSDTDPCRARSGLRKRHGAPCDRNRDRESTPAQGDTAPKPSCPMSPRTSSGSVFDGEHGPATCPADRTDGDAGACLSESRSGCGTPRVSNLAWSGNPACSSPDRSDHSRRIEMENDPFRSRLRPHRDRSSYAQAGADRDADRSLGGNGGVGGCRTTFDTMRSARRMS